MPLNSADIRLFVAIQSMATPDEHQDLQELVKAKYNVNVASGTNDLKTSSPHLHLIQAAHHAFEAAQGYDQSTHLHADDLAELASHTGVLLARLQVPMSTSTHKRSTCSIYDQNVTADHLYQSLGCKLGKFQISASEHNLVTGINAVTFVMTLSTKKQASVLICDSLPSTHRQPTSKFALTGSHFVTSGKNVVQLEQSVMRSHFHKTRCEEPSTSMHIRKQMKTSHVNSIKNIIPVTSHTNTALQCGEFGSLWSTCFRINTQLDQSSRDNTVLFYSFFMR